MSKRLTVEDWDDVADLCEVAGDMAGVTITGEEPMHTWVAKEKTAKWIYKLSMKAHNNARRIEAKEKK